MGCEGDDVPQCFRVWPRMGPTPLANPPPTSDNYTDDNEPGSRNETRQVDSLQSQKVKNWGAGYILVKRAEFSLINK